MEEKNKYQEVLNNIKLEILNCGCCEGDYDKNICKIKCEKQKDILLLQKLVDKETPKEPIEESMIQEFKIKVFQLKCPICKIGKVGQIFEDDRKKEGVGFANYCPKCGQKIKW